MERMECTDGSRFRLIVKRRHTHARAKSFYLGFHLHCSDKPLRLSRLPSHTQTNSRMWFTILICISKAKQKKYIVICNLPKKNRNKNWNACIVLLEFDSTKNSHINKVTNKNIDRQTKHTPKKYIYTKRNVHKTKINLNLKEEWKLTN